MSGGSIRNRSSSDACAQSICNLCQVLEEALKNPQAASSTVIEACRSQSSLAALSLPSHGIVALSRNSVSKFADLVLVEKKIPNDHPGEGGVGFRYLDWLRKEVFRVGKKRSLDRSASARSDRVNTRLREMSCQVDELRKHSLAVGQAYFDLFSSLKGLYGNEDLEPTTRYRIRNLMHDHDRRYSDLFQEVGSLRPDNVESI